MISCTRSSIVFSREGMTSPGKKGGGRFVASKKGSELRDRFQFKIIREKVRLMGRERQKKKMVRNRVRGASYRGKTLGC